MIPETIKIGGTVYKIIYDDNIKGCWGEKAVGRLIPERSVLYIDINCGIQAQEQILCHETVHGMLRFCNIDAPEDYVERLGRVLYQVLKDNNLNFEEG